MSYLERHFAVIREVTIVVVKGSVFRLCCEKKCQSPFDHFVIDMHKILPFRKQAIGLMKIPGSEGG